MSACTRRGVVPAFASAIQNRTSTALFLLLATLFGFAGCARPPGIIPPELRKPIDRSLVEFPAGLQFERFITGLTAPSAMAFDTQKNAMLVAESGADDGEPRILGFDLNNGSSFTVYPQGKVFGPFRSIPFRMYGPIGGMAVREGKIYISHRDKNGMGVISAVGYDGKGSTVIAGLPAQGDYGVTDVQFGPNGRLYFGVGATTNSGVVGLDNWDRGWVPAHEKLADVPYFKLRTRGPRFFSVNPFAGLFTGSEQAITAAFQPFGVFYRSTIDAAPDGKANAAVYSVQPSGDIDLKLIAHGIRYPAGLAFDPAFDQLYVSNQGMELRGTRPVRDDPNAILRIPPGQFWGGWPDYSTTLQPITLDAFQPPPEMVEYMRRTGYTENILLVDNDENYRAPTASDERYVRAVLPPLSGASKMAFLPNEGPLGEFPRNLVIALNGDRAPFATHGQKLKRPVGYKLVRVDVDSDAKVVHDFIRNTANLPRSMVAGGKNPDLLERPIDVKMGPDGFLYVLDFGRLEMHGGKERVNGRTGQVFRLLPASVPSTGPAMPQADRPNRDQ